MRIDTRCRGCVARDIRSLTDADLEMSHVNVTDIGDVEQRTALRNLIENYKPNRMYETNIKMKILLKDEEPVYQLTRRLSPSERSEVNAQIDEWLAEGIVQPSVSDYVSSVVLVRKKDGSARLCMNYLLNKKILKIRYPLPLIEDQLDLLQDARVFTTLDLRNGFFLVELDELNQKYTAFVDHYEFLKVSFGLCNSPASEMLQRFVNSTFRNLIREGTVLVYTTSLSLRTISSNGIRLEKMFEVAGEAGLEKMLFSAGESGVPVVTSLREGMCVRPTGKARRFGVFQSPPA